MIEETAKIHAIDTDSGMITVEIQRQSSCGSCSVRSGCGTATIAKVLGKRRSLLKLNYSKRDVSVGDTVVLGLSEGALVKGSLAVYSVPLLLMLGFAVLGDMLAEQLTLWNADSVSVMFALLGLFFGIIWLRHFATAIQDKKQYQPVVLRKNTLMNCVEQ